MAVVPPMGLWRSLAATAGAWGAVALGIPWVPAALAIVAGYVVGSWIALRPRS